MKPIYILLLCIALLFLYVDVQAQSDSTFKKIDFSVNIFENFMNKETMPDGATYSAQQALIATYPFQYRSIQYGFAFGYESLRTQEIDSLTYHERRIPILISNKFYLGNSIPVYFETQFGTALTMKSVSINEAQEEFNNSRDNIGLPVIVNGGIGFEIISEHDMSIGLEIGFAYKQLGYKNVSKYDSKAFYLGLFLSIP